MAALLYKDFMSRVQKRLSMKWRQNGKRGFLLPYLFGALFLCALVAALFMLLRTLGAYERGRAIYTEVIEIAVATPAPQSTAQPVSAAPIRVDFDTLRSIAPNTAAWLYGEDTIISYPVMASSDNDFYLTHAWDGQESVNGALFFDCRQPQLFTGNHLLLYGHNMKDGSMFASLNGYRKQAYYDAHPTLTLLTTDGNYRVVLFSARVVPVTEAYFPMRFASEADKLAYTDTALTESFFEYTDQRYDGAPILTLSTCSHEHENHDPRLLVHGWLLSDTLS